MGEQSWGQADDESAARFLHRVMAAPVGSVPTAWLPVPLGERSYGIALEPGGRHGLGRVLAQRFPGVARVAVVTNPTVGALYFADLERSLSEAGFTVMRIDVPDSEKAKRLEVVAQVTDQLIAARFERREPIVALGGGVVGDLAGFVASIYLRSVPYVQVPTTLLAQVDSSIGGKTAVNTPRGKNLIGSFYQPRHVLIDTEVLQTLPDVEYRAGLAAVVKYGAIRDAAFFHYLEGHVSDILARDIGVLGQLIFRSCVNKALVVMEDEREQGQRALLNFGHTLGHAFETLGQYAGLRHGEAVAIGMVFAARLSRVLGHCGRGVESRLTALLEALGLPTRPAEVTVQDCLDVMAVDKKVRGGKVRFVLLEDVGKAFLEPLDFGVIEPVLSDFLAERC